MIAINIFFILITVISLIGIILSICNKDILGISCFLIMIIIGAHGSIQSYKEYEDKTKSTLDINPYKSIKEKTDTIYIKIK